MPAVDRRTLLRYAIGFNLVIVAFGIGLLFPQRSGLVLSLFVAAVAVATWKGGWKVGLVTTGVSLAALPIGFGGVITVAHLALFALVGITTTALLGGADRVIQARVTAPPPRPESAEFERAVAERQAIDREQEAIRRRLEQELSLQRVSLREQIDAERETARADFDAQLEAARTEIWQKVDAELSRERESIFEEAEQQLRQQIAAERAAARTGLEERLEAARREIAVETESALQQQIAAERERADLEGRLETARSQTRLETDEQLRREQEALREQAEKQLREQIEATRIAAQQELENRLRPEREAMAREMDERFAAALEGERTAAEGRLSSRLAEARGEIDRALGQRLRERLTEDQQSAEQSLQRQLAAERQQIAQRLEQQLSRERTRLEEELRQRLEARLAAEREQLLVATEHDFRERVEAERRSVALVFARRLEQERAEIDRQNAQQFEDALDQIRKEAQQQLREQLESERESVRRTILADFEQQLLADAERERASAEAAMRERLQSEREAIRARYEEQFISARAAITREVEAELADANHAAKAAARRRRRALPLVMYIGLPLLVMVVYTNISDVLIRNFAIPSILQPLVLFLAIPVLRYRDAFRPESTLVRPLTILLIGYCLVVFASSNWARDVGPADSTLADLVKNLLILIVAASLAASWQALRGALIALVGGAVVLAILTLAQIAVGDADLQFGGLAALEEGHLFGELRQMRPGGPVGDPNYFGRILLLALPAAAFLGVGRRSRSERAGYLAAAGVIALAILFTYSRGVMLALAAVAVLLVVARRVRLTWVNVLIVVAVLAALVPTTVGQRILTMEQFISAGLEGGVLEPSIDKRRELLAVGWRMFTDHPLLGVGAGNFGNHYRRYANRVGWAGHDSIPLGVRQYPHNLYLEMAVETGLIGLLLFVGAMTVALVTLFRSRQELLGRGESAHAALVTAIAIALVGYLISSLFLHSGFQKSLWLLLGFAVAAVRLTVEPPLRNHS